MLLLHPCHSFELHVITSCRITSVATITVANLLLSELLPAAGAVVLKHFVLGQPVPVKAELVGGCCWQTAMPAASLSCCMADRAQLVSAAQLSNSQWSNERMRSVVQRATRYLEDDTVRTVCVDYP